VTPKRWQQIRGILEEALETPYEERMILVRNRCNGDATLETEVLRLLQTDETSDPSVDAPALNPPGSLDEHEQPYSFTAGSLIANRFEILRFLNRGGMGEVYEAWDLELKERVALKTVRSDIAFNPTVLERFKREVKQARGISHPNVCRVHELFSHDAGSQGKIWFLSMEFLDGVTLFDHIRHRGSMEPAAALPLVEQMVHGLIAAHALGVIHRDFKTGNVMLVSHGPGRVRAVITDFGLALNVLGPREGLREPGGQGTPAFMAPEQRETGEVTFLADQYALGVVICEMLTGSRPIQTESNRPGAKPSIKLPDGISDPRWKGVVLRCLQTQPEDRFKSMEEVLAALTPPRTPARKWAWAAAAALLSLAVVVGIWYFSKPGMQATSIAVLPLQNHTGDAKLDYLGAGISEALTDDLSLMPDLQVTAENIAKRYGGDGIDLTAAGRTLRVRSIVAGSIAMQKEVLQVPIELIDVKTGRQVWGRTYEGDLARLTDLQHEISTDVAYRLKIRLDADAKARLKRQYSTDPATYDAYLKGRFQLAQRSPDALQAAINDFQRALDHDSQYAPAYAGLADSYSLLAYYGLQEPIPLLTKAMAAAQHALEIDSTLGEAYTSRAAARIFLNFDWQGAEADYKRAIELNPNYLNAHTWYGLDLLPQGRWAEAAAQLEYTRASDPDSLVTVCSLATMYYYTGNFDRSAALVEPLVRTSHPAQPALDILASDYLAMGQNANVIALLDKGQQPEELERQWAVPLGIAYARTGQTAKASAKLKLIETGVRDGSFISYHAALLYTSLNDPKRAFDMLELAYARREPDLIFLNVDPVLAPLRSEPRFVKLLGLMNLR
jgi:TolB-like protein/Flp pilus assembly protein TadD